MKEFKYRFSAHGIMVRLCAIDPFFVMDFFGEPGNYPFHFARFAKSLEYSLFLSACVFGLEGAAYRPVPLPRVTRPTRGPVANSCKRQPPQKERAEDAADVSAWPRL
ncbi:unnamed protein product [Ectocarpus fasciculatus]